MGQSENSRAGSIHSPWGISPLWRTGTSNPGTRRGPDGVTRPATTPRNAWTTSGQAGFKFLLFRSAQIARTAHQPPIMKRPYISRDSSIPIFAISKAPNMLMKGT